MLRRVLRITFENSILLILGAAAALAWASIDYGSYEALVHHPLWNSRALAAFVEGGGHILDLRSLTNNILMALFFALAGKTIWEAMYPGGPLHSVREAATPLIATLGGMAGPAVIYLLGAKLTGHLPELARGWAIPCATDIAFSYLVARLIFGGAHPAIPFLLLLAIADDFGSSAILALFYPLHEVHLPWLMLCVGAVLVAVGFKRLRIYGFWWYLLIPGALSWLGFGLAGLHPALGLLPIIPTLPHVHRPVGDAEQRRAPHEDTLGRMEQALKAPVEIILALFGFLNAGAPLGSLGTTTAIVLAGFLIGKPLGISLSTLCSVRVLRMKLPQGLGWRELLTLGCTAGIGFTFALLVTSVAFPPGPIQEAARMGSLASLGAAVPALVLGKALGVKRRPTPGSTG